MITSIDNEKIINEIRNRVFRGEIYYYLDDDQEFSEEKVGSIFSALANEAFLADKNAGWFYIEISGKYNENMFRSILSDLSQFIEIKRLSSFTDENHFRCLYNVTPALHGLPVSFKGHFYGLENNSVVPLSLQKMDIIRYNFIIKDWSSEICKGATIDHLDKFAVQKGKEGFKIRYFNLSREADSWDTLTFLQKAGFARGEDLFNSALLVFGSEESRYLINPSDFQIKWIILDNNGREKGFQTYSMPLISNFELIFNRLANLKYDYSQKLSVAPVTTLKYELRVLQEILINSVIHQDYNNSGIINVYEYPDKIEIINNGSFAPGSFKKLLEGCYFRKTNQNLSLIQGLFNINFINNLGGSIRNASEIYKLKKFPLPDISLIPGNIVKATVYGAVLNPNYTEKLISNPEMDLITVFLLDCVQKGILIEEEDANLLRKKNLVVGRYPDLQIASKTIHREEQPVFVAKKVYTADEIKDLLIEYLQKKGEAGRQEIDNLLLDKYPKDLNEEKRRNKIKNLLYQLSRVENLIINDGSATKPVWKLKK